MARNILRPRQQTESRKQQILTVDSQQQCAGSQLAAVPAKTALILRRPRSQEYMAAMQRLDAGGAHLDPRLAEELAAIIAKEFPRVEVPKILIGVVSRCYLGEPYEVHTLDMSGQVIRHYKRGEALPDGLERARHLALSGSYDFIEVYMDACRAVSEDGSVAVLTI